MAFTHHGQVCVNLMLWHPKHIRSITAMWAQRTYLRIHYARIYLAWWAVKWRNSKNHKAVKIGGWVLARVWAFAWDNTVHHNYQASRHFAALGNYGIASHNIIMKTYVKHERLRAHQCYSDFGTNLWSRYGFSYKCSSSSYSYLYSSLVPRLRERRETCGLGTRLLTLLTFTLIST